MQVTNHNSVPFLKSLTTCLNRIVAEGYTEDFKLEQEHLTALQHNRHYWPQQLKVINSFRFEGFSNPNDNAILYLIETFDGLKGTLLDAFNLSNPSQINDFIREVENTQRKAV